MIDTVLKYLIDNKITVATAESCTAGMISARIGDMSGVSDVFSEGFVTYSNEAKVKNLGVPKEIIDTHGAVSEECARAMAEGVAKVTGSRLGLSATGIAGPTGGTATKPVGTVYMGVCFDGVTTVEKCVFSGDRKQVRTQTIDAIFAHVKKRLQI